MLFTFITLYIFCVNIVNSTNTILTASYCFGDSSAGQNLLDITCSTGVIRFHEILAGAKPKSLNCSAEDQISHPSPPELCCFYNETDCTASYTGSRDNFLNCNGKPQCHGIAVARMPSNSTCWDRFLTYTNYMTFEYYCIPDGHILGLCNGTQDCMDPNTICNKSLCVCTGNYSTLDPFDSCWQDGHLNGACAQNFDCVDEFTVCTSNNRCVCNVTYSSFNGKCVKDGHLNGTCIQNLDCVDRNAMCSSNRCVCNAAYTSINGKCVTVGDNDGPCFPDLKCNDANAQCNDAISRCKCKQSYTNINFVCRQDGSLYGKCINNVTCTDVHTECGHDNMCVCTVTYSPFNGTCVEDGENGGFCVVTIDCADAHALCVNNICTCNNNYSDINHICVHDGDIGGMCLPGHKCNDANAQCNNSTTKCECKQSYTSIESVCAKDGLPGGRCTKDGDCKDSNSNCTANGICACISHYSAVNFVCVKDYGDGGVCDPSDNCTDSNASCVPDVTQQCGFKNCKPGLCRCKPKFSIDLLGFCVADGELGGTCRRDSDCRDPNANCNSVTWKCECSVGYSKQQSICVEDGQPDGKCPNRLCLDPHSICVNNTCLCNSYRMYILRNGVCVRIDDYVHGNCVAGCNDTNAACINNLCTCKPTYADVNGMCISSNTSSVTSCKGGSPYNQLVPECNRGQRAIILQSYVLFKQTQFQCPPEMNEYDHSQFIKCCTYSKDDCRLDGNSENNCNISVPQGINVYNVTYNVMEYICVNDGTVINMNDNSSITGNSDYIAFSDNTTGTGKRTCSVKATCQTDIIVYLVFLAFTDAAHKGSCSQSLQITEDLQSNNISCERNNINAVTQVYKAKSGFFTITYTGTNTSGNFVLKIEATQETASVIISCGSKTETEKPTSFPSCDPQQVVQKPPAANSSKVTILLAILIPLILLILLLILLILLRDRIKRACCPAEKEPIKTSPIVGVVSAYETDPTPGNVKFHGKIPWPDDVAKDTPPWSAQPYPNMKFLRQLPIDTKLPKFLPPLPNKTHINRKSNASDSKLPLSKQPSVEDFVRTEISDVERKMQNNDPRKAQSMYSARGNDVGKNIRYPNKLNQILPVNLAAGKNVTQFLKEKSKALKKKTKQAKLKKAKNLIKAANGLMLPNHAGQNSEGSFQPNETLYYNKVLQPRDLQPSFQGSRTQQPDYNANDPTNSMKLHHAPNVTLNNYMQTPTLYEELNMPMTRSFGARSTWQLAGNVTSVATMPSTMRRKSVLEIANFDDPSEIDASEV